MTPSSFQRSRDTAQPSILVVEDETIIGLDLRERLTDYGYYVTQVVAAGAEAVEAALVNRPRLVLMDIRLKGPMDGITAAERIREAADIPIVFLTAYVDEDTLLRAHDVSPYGYVLKPFKSEQLQVAIDIALERHRAEQELQAALSREAEARRFAEALQQTAARLARTLKLDEVLDQLMASISLIVDATGSAIYLVDEEHKAVHLARFHSTPELPSPEGGSHLIAAYPILQAVCAERDYTLLATSLPDVQALALPLVPAWSQSLIGLPFAYNGRVMGLILVYADEEHRFDGQDASRLAALGSQAATGIHNARLFENAEHRNDELMSHVLDRTAELERLKDRIETILDNTPDLILLLDADGRVVASNRTLRDLVEVSSNGLYGTDPTWLLVPTDRQRLSQAIQLAIRTQSPQRLSKAVRLANYDTIDLDVQIAPLVQDESVTGLVCSFHDVTPLTEVDRLKDELIANVSHELRTPIANIKLYHDLLTLNQDKWPTYLETLKRETSRLEYIVEELLILSQFDQEDVELMVERIDIGRLLEALVSDRDAAAAEAQLDLVYSPPDEPLTLVGDRNLLSQAFSVLVTNALNYTPEGGHVTVSVESVGRGGETWVQISVADTGPGIQSDEIERIFERFYRGTAGRASGRPGTGLGLAIAQECINRHRGTITVRSEPGVGTAFMVFLPTTTL